MCLVAIEYDVYVQPVRMNNMNNIPVVQYIYIVVNKVTVIHVALLPAN